VASALAVYEGRAESLGEEKRVPAFVDEVRGQVEAATAFCYNGVS
jgi:hypothetical protein